MLDMTDTPKHKLRWFQFSLRSLLLFVLLVSVGMSWFAVKMQQAKRQKEAVAAIERLGGEVFYDYQYRVLDVHTIFVTEAQPPGPEWLQRLLGNDFFSTVTFVRFIRRKVNVNDAELEHIINDLPQLRFLDLPGTEVTDAGLERLGKLSGLQSLILSDTQITDAGLQHLSQMPQLKDLCLGGTKVTDAGLGSLRVLTRLDSLDLDRTQVTDAGIDQLKGLVQLDTLNLAKTKVTDAGVKKLEQALPNCHIVRQLGH
jgi:hypothetical protein